MVFTHIVVGACLALPVLALAPSLAVPAALAGMAGGLAPDVDLFVGHHRRTLHFPVVGWALALPACAAALLAPTPWTAGAATFALAFAVHAGSDALGAGNEVRPWERSSAEAVYDHLHGTWWRPRYLVRYDGAPEDLFVTAVGALPGVLLVGGVVRTLCLVCVALGTVYVLVRRNLPPSVEEFIG
ncbi:hypothetical protein [Candidatus Halobonum tyrrellensis]|uniref:Membrane-bound metal-dependent hydrolase n=1 Tax=Candidatus Halobonum tyrrellensis G22 TaxID=1324957 RepID=V4IXK2_9EURY|nr:hypothetical protein [Candidatus Halobonum tyrrellensis]ESP87887.1 hypothetical protein K933_11241 [Candidatus Halobonum tyrrellensis G22]